MSSYLGALLVCTLVFASTTVAYWLAVCSLPLFRLARADWRHLLLCVGWYELALCGSLVVAGDCLFARPGLVA